MGVVLVPPIVQLVKLWLIGSVFICQGSSGYNISPSLAIVSEIPPIEGIPGPVYQQKSSRSYAPSLEPQPNGPNLHPPLALPPLTSAPLPHTTTGFVPSYSPATPMVKPPHDAAPSPMIFQGNAPSLSPRIPNVSSPPNVASPPFIGGGHVPSLPTDAPQRVPVAKSPTPKPSVPDAPQNAPILPAAPESLAPGVHQPNTSFNGAPVTTQIRPVALPPRKSEGNQPPESLAPSVHQQNASSNGAPVREQFSPVASPPRKSEGNQPPESLAPSGQQQNASSNGAPVSTRFGPVASPPMKSEGNQPPVDPITPASIPSVTVPDISHASSPSPSIDWRNDGAPVTAPPDETPKSLSPANNSQPKGSFSAAAPSTQKNMWHSGAAPAPFPSSPQGHRSPASLPSFPFDKHNHTRKKTNSPAPVSPHTVSPRPKQQGPAIPPFLPESQVRGAPPSHSPVPAASGLHHEFSKPAMDASPAPAPAPSPSEASSWTKMPLLPHKVPHASPTRSPKIPVLPPIHTLPPPPPNEDCSAFICTEPYANTPPGSPCGCVLPMQVGLRLGVALYTFFPLVSELAQEIASGVFMKQSQVRIMGANAASQQPEKTIVLIDLVPLGERFDNTTAFLTYHRFWHKEVAIKASLFGDYEVLYVRYPGLPSSPPTPSDISIIDDGPYSGKGNNGRAIKPLGVDIHKTQHKNGLTGGVIAIIALSASAALVLCSVVAWILLFRRRNDDSRPMQAPQPLPPSVAKPPGTTVSMMGSGLSSASLSFGSSIAPYAGSAKTFSTNDIEKATNNFDNSRVLGEGGFGRVYHGILEDGTEVAVKVLKRDDQQGGREFLAEIEMLSRLHHRNLVKLIGICTEERARCLVYELIPNGSVESHLHGVDKESAPLDWDARIKIALGAARGLAYLHEDSSPRVIHRDFKASNILLEHDFTPKVSDFGLARTALDEESRHISTRVMGTFGYVAPEYAMTGHLLVKSDVYSYGVVLLELLTGRKPVDMSQPPGQENLVAWARPLLTSKEGLEMLIEPSLGPDVPFDSVAKVAAIASMCVQPEVSHRPFMGEVVQALKLVCNECDEAKEVGSRSSSQDFSINMDAGASAGSGHLAAPFQDQNLLANYDSEPDVERGLSLSELFSTSARYARETSGSLRRCSSSGPLRTRRGRRLWERMRRMNGEGVSEHGIIPRLWPGSQ